MAGVVDRSKYEVTWANQQVPVHQKPHWNLLHSIHRHYVTEHSILVVWRLTGGKPTNVRLLVIKRAQLDMAKGIAIQLGVDKDARPVELGHTPTPLIGNQVFGWVPYFCDVRWTPKLYEEPDSSHFSLHVPLCIKTESNFYTNPIEGHIYVTALSSFRKDWPAYRSLTL